jgi:hypothetical protein
MADLSNLPDLSEAIHHRSLDRKSRGALKMVTRNGSKIGTFFIILFTGNNRINPPDRPTSSFDGNVEDGQRRE